MELERLREEVDQMRSHMGSLQHELDRLQERRDDDRALLIEVREAVTNLGDQFKASVSAVHKRVDVLQAEKERERGRAEGRSEAKALMFKWVGAIVALIAIVGWINSPARSEALPPRDKIEERRP